MKTIHHILLAAGLLAVSTASAINIDTVRVGNAGNAGQVQSQGTFGGVSYDYHIGTYEVTNAQYAMFLNSVAFNDTHGLWNENMGTSTHGGINRAGSSGSFSYSVKSGFDDKPVNFVSFWDAARFSNWLTTGDTETGVYNLNGTTNPTNNTITRDATAWANGGVAIASENEWYKAAYYNPTLNSGNGGYWLYPTQSDTVPTATTPNNTNANSVNRSGSLSPNSDTVTPVGAYTLAASFYGTFDQGGNVWEWNDQILGNNDLDRGLRGGAYNTTNVTALESSRRDIGNGPTTEIGHIGFRVSSLEPIPEPSTYAAILGGLGLAIALIRRKRRGTL